MKVRMIAAFYTLLILAAGIFLWTRLNKEVSFSIDMLDLNTKCDEISDKLSSGTSAEQLEKEYGCDITLLKDDNYDSVNNHFIREGLSVFDYREDGVIKGKIAFNA
jgi:hypothetical protein